MTTRSRLALWIPATLLVVGVMTWLRWESPPSPGPRPAAPPVERAPAPVAIPAPEPPVEARIPDEPPLAAGDAILAWGDEEESDRDVLRETIRARLSAQLADRMLSDGELESAVDLALDLREAHLELRELQRSGDTGRTEEVHERIRRGSEELREILDMRASPLVSGTPDPRASEPVATDADGRPFAFGPLVDPEDLRPTGSPP